MSDKNPGAPGAPRKRRNRRRKPSGGAPAGQQASQASQAPQAATSGPTQSAAPNGPRRNNKRRRRGGSNRNNPAGVAGNGPNQKTGQLERLITKYENLRTQHLEARRKYFDLFERADPQQKDKLERVFTNTALKMREFEEALGAEDKELFDRHYNGLKEDRIYSENHQLDPEGEKAAEQKVEPEDPHFLISQKQANYSDDTEESMGSYEDYMSYKGIS